MGFLPHTDSEREEMLSRVGVSSFDDLYDAVPADLRFPELDLPPALSEMEAMQELKRLAGRNKDLDSMATFLGAGAYNHFIPSVVDSILRRNEFYTAYTPYQPEVSQGTLQAIFEYQSMICHLTGMDVSNASIYDGATALAEAVGMSLTHARGKRRRILLGATVHPQYQETVRTYLRGEDVDLDLGSNLRDPVGEMLAEIDDQTAFVAVQYPDFLGQFDDLTELGREARAAGAWLCVVANPIALGLLKPPGEYGADVVVGEGQPLGIPLSFGGPYLGFLATREEHVRKLPGRLVGETVDVGGQRGYVLTLTPREQHIRRSKATSNICTNQGLMTLAAAVYMSAMGRSGLRRVAELCYHKAHYAAEMIDGLPGYSLWNSAEFFHEFVVRTERPISEINRALRERGIIGGYDLGSDFSDLEGHMLLAVTEVNTRRQIDELVDALEDLADA